MCVCFILKEVIFPENLCLQPRAPISPVSHSLLQERQHTIMSRPFRSSDIHIYHASTIGLSFQKNQFYLCRAFAVRDKLGWSIVCPQNPQVLFITMSQVMTIWGNIYLHIKDCNDDHNIVQNRRKLNLHMSKTLLFCLMCIDHGLFYS